MHEVSYYTIHFAGRLVDSPRRLFIDSKLTISRAIISAPTSKLIWPFVRSYSYTK